MPASARFQNLDWPLSVRTESCVREWTAWAGASAVGRGREGGLLVVALFDRRTFAFELSGISLDRRVPPLEFGAFLVAALGPERGGRVVPLRRILMRLRRPTMPRATIATRPVPHLATPD